MGTPANLEALATLGATADAAPGDVVIAVDADGDGAAALDGAERDLASSGGDAEERPAALPRSLPVAVRQLGGANVALISVPGEYAVLEAHRALTEGMHVFLFSDHVSAADEVELKRRGADRGLLVMGPGCGTAMLGGVGLGFANAVRRGPVGVVAAAGTGAQEVAVLLHGAGVGVSQIVGVGGRDLTAEVGGIMFRQAMELLAADDETETLLLVSKPPAPEVVRALGDVDVARQARRGGVRRLGRRRGAVRDPPHARRRRVRRRGRRAADGRRRRRAGLGRRPARALLRRLARARGGDDPRSRPSHPRPRRGGVHAGPPASDGRPRGPPRSSCARRVRRPDACCSTW